MSKISVVILIYNAEKYLRKCIDSVINQTYQNIEIICVNNGSTDSSIEIIKEYCNKNINFDTYNKSMTQFHLYHKHIQHI